VLLKLPPLVSIAHVSLAMVVLGLNSTIALATGRGWLQDETRLEPAEARGIAGWALATLIAVYLQIVLGAIPRHATAAVGGATLVIVGDALHIVWAFAVFTAVILLAAKVVGRHSKVAPLFRPAALLLFLLILQFFIGFVTFLTQPKEPGQPAEGLHELSATSHQALGALMLVAALVLTLRAWRVRRRSLSPARVEEAAA
jgi:heme A synthase